MNRNINLLIKEDIKLLKQKKIIKTFRVVAIGSLLVVLFISASIYLLNRRVSSTSIEKDQESLLNQMLPLRKREVKLTIVNNRIKNISDVLKNRIDTYKIYSTLLGKVPDSISVNGLELTDKTVAIRFSSDSLRSVDVFLNNLIDMATKKEIISTVVLNSLSAGGGARKYLVSINADL